MPLDDAHSQFCNLVTEWAENNERIETEQDARFHMINRVLTEVLNWPYGQIKTEPHVQQGYIDYLLHDGGRNKMVVEAKRISVLLSDTKLPNMAAYKVQGPALKSAAESLIQAERYCLETGVPFCVVTNGIEWIAHWPMRGDGRPRSAYKAIVFPSHDSIKASFAAFYDLFSYEGVLAELFKVHINENEGLAIRHTETLRPIRDPKSSKLLRKTAIGRDLQPIFREFFSSMSGDNDPEMLAKCFVESKESNEADASLEIIARNLINQIEVVEGK